MTSWLDGKPVVLGEVAEQESVGLVTNIEGLGSPGGRTTANVTIADSGMR